MAPPTSGPSTGPISAGTVSQAMEPTSSCLGTVLRITSRPTGTIMAPPMPWTMRPTTSPTMPSASPHRIEPKVNTRIASRNTSRAP